MSNRTRTRDLLLEFCTDIMPPRPNSGDTCFPADPSSAEMKIVYPWENYSLGSLVGQLYTIASDSGFTGSYEDFKNNFGSYLERNNQEIIFEIYNHFPQVGDADHLYFDLGEKILYHWDNGYIPVNAMLIANTILEGGEA